MASTGLAGEGSSTCASPVGTEFLVAVWAVSDWSAVPTLGPLAAAGSTSAKGGVDVEFDAAADLRLLPARRACLGDW